MCVCVHVCVWYSGYLKNGIAHLVLGFTVMLSHSYTDILTTFFIKYISLHERYFVTIYYCSHPWKEKITD